METHTLRNLLWCPCHSSSPSTFCCSFPSLVLHYKKHLTETCQVVFPVPVLTGSRKSAVILLSWIRSLGSILHHNNTQMAGTHPGGTEGQMEWPGRDTRKGGAQREVQGRAKVFFTLSFHQANSLCSIWEPAGWHRDTPHQQTGQARMWRDTPLWACMGTLKTHYSCSQGILDLSQCCG